MEDHDVRISFDISQETHTTIVDNIPHGMRKYLYRAMMDGLADELRKDPRPVLMQLVTATAGRATIDPRTISIMKEKEDE